MFPFANPRSARRSVLRPQNVFAAIPYSVTSQGVSVAVPFAPDFVWAKARNAAYSHYLFDVLRGNGNTLSTNNTGAEVSLPAPYARISGNSFTDPGYDTGNTAVAWPFKRAPKFFDVVTYPGNGTSGRQIPHGLGIVPGMMIFRRRDAVQNWWVYHRSVVSPNASWWTNYLTLNTTAAANPDSPVNGQPTDTFIVPSQYLNAAGASYEILLFAHDPDPNGIIQCGSYVGNATSVSINLGWQPQFILLKNASAAASWFINDSARGMSSTSSPRLSPNLSDAEVDSGGVPYSTATGFVVSSNGGNYNASGNTYIYLAIRAPIT